MRGRRQHLEAEDIRACLAYAVEVLDKSFGTFEEWTSEADRLGFADL